LHDGKPATEEMNAQLKSHRDPIIGMLTGNNASPTMSKRENRTERMKKTKSWKVYIKIAKISKI
jgi:hypothetical protein